MSDNTPEKRRFHRIEFDAPCELHWQDQVWETQVLDISLKGVLVVRPDAWDVPLKEPCEVVVHLNDNETGIVMAVALRHIEPHRLGFKCEYIDLESASHLKRLVELNLGDQALLEREFAHLIE
ncbi:PilZ domain-containing protein [Marinobacter salinisoli]|uniref:Cyclic diguanosine monophosphate-binding protein n=1 Tax=Marinobacter salinisoli TaxID=2769486 RepID=A0ABX7MUN5_9GAMM|nr:PilZ domain-containing protein [Marinobacter salinisoli]QSP96097.1 PilZ domain-containing protein [Marinobacter salinisoli]